MVDDIETAEDYQEHYEAEADESTSRYGHYVSGKAEAAELINGGEVDSATELNGIAQERYTDAGANTVEAAVAKGMLDATSELADLGALDEDDPSTEPEEPDDFKDGDDDEEEETISAGGVEVDADDFADWDGGDDEDEDE